MQWFDQLYEYFDRPNRASPAGKPYVEPQWLRWQTKMGFESNRLMFFTLNIRRFIIVICWLFIMAGILPPVRILLSIAVPFLIFMHMQNRRCWRNSAYVAVSAESFPTTVRANQEFDVELVVTNFGKTIVPSVIIQINFAGDHRAFQYKLIQNLKPRHKSRLSFRFCPDVGWGEFPLGPVSITVRDELGMYVKTIEDDVHGSILVEPEHQELVSKIRVTRSSLAMHSGSFELAVPGRSVSFLGLRPWVDGDAKNSIDWKRSMRVGELVVKDFERFSATDATIIFDRSNIGHSEFGRVSTFRTMLETVMGVLQCLVRQQIRSQLLSFGFEVPFGKTPGFYAEVCELLIDVTPVNCGAFADQLAHHSLQVPPSSLLFLISTTGNMDLDNIMGSLVGLTSENVEPILILIDSASYGKEVSQMANLDRLDEHSVLARLLSSYERHSQEVKKVVDQIAERTYIVDPQRPLAGLYDESVGL